MLWTTTACALVAFAAGNVPNGPNDVDPEHSHTGLHPHDFPAHTSDEGHLHDLTGHEHVAGGGRPLATIVQLDFDELRSTRFMYSGAFENNGARSIAAVHANRIVPHLQEIIAHADDNHPRDGQHERGQYDPTDPDDATTAWIRSRFIRMVLSDPPPRVHNPLTLACRYSNCLHYSNREPGTTELTGPNTDKQMRCLVGSQGHGGAGTYGAIQCKCAVRPQSTELDFGEVEDEDSHCQSCAADGTDNCEQCGDDHYLHSGECIEGCPEHHESVGMSRFNRVCRPLSCVNRRDSCEQCHTVHDKCINCRDSTYLHENTCHTECPALFEGVGNGRYNRRCRLDEACRRNVDGCNICSGGNTGLSGTTCTQCKQFTNLHEGSCHAECPEGFMTRPGINAASQFKRVCIPNLPASECQASRDHCFRCDGFDPDWETMVGGTEPQEFYRGWYGPECMMCRDEWYLHNGACVEACPEGTVGRGRGKFRRVCLM